MVRKKKLIEKDLDRDEDDDVEIEEEDNQKESAQSGGSIRLGEFGSAVIQLAEEKGISEEKVMEVVEAALSAAYKKDYGKRGQMIRTEFDRVAKSAKYFLVKEVVDETTREFFDEEVESVGADETKMNNMPVSSKEKTDETFKESFSLTEEEERLPRFNAERDMTLEEALKIDSNAKVGDTIEIPLPPQQEFGRVAAQTAKQVIIQRIREAERESMFAEYKSKEGTIVNGVVQRVDGRIVFVDLGKSVGALFPSEQIEGENYRVGLRLKVYIVRVETDSRGHGITLSRSHAEMVRHLFMLEVPEIFSGTVEIKAIAREAGSRTKIAVWTSEEGVDPIGSCVGQKGTRVQAVIDELGGEKIDIIEWSPDTQKFIKASLNPAKVTRVELHEEEKSALVFVPEDQLSLAIGRKGQNVRLATKLTGLRIDIVGSESRKGGSKQEVIENGELEDTEERHMIDDEQQDENLETKIENQEEDENHGIDEEKPPIESQK